MAATRARAFALLCLVAAARAGPKVRKPPKVELDESKLPPLESVLAELGVADVLPQLQAKGLDSTRQLCKWSRSDVSIHGMELGWSRDLQKEVLAKIAALVAGAAKAAEAVVVDELAALRDERNNLTYGRVYVDRSSASFEYRRAWFGARLPESPLPMVMAAPRNGCAPLPPAIYAGAVVLADRGGCGFVDKAWVAHAAGARAVAVLNAADGPFDRPTAGYATDAEVTPSPGDVAVALLHHDAKNGLKDAAAAPLVALGDAAVIATQATGRWRSRLERAGLLEPRVDATQGPWDARDATRLSFVPLKCAAGQPECKPVLPAERAMVPDVDSGTVAAGGETHEFVASVWGGVLPSRPLAVVAASPYDLCARPPHLPCRLLGLFCPGPRYGDFAARAPGALVVAKRGGGCSFAVKAVHAAALGAAVLAVAQNDSAPLLRMGIRFPPAPPPVAGISVGEAGEAALLALAASGNATRPAYASLELAKPPGFAHKWLELSGAEPWPEDEANAAKERKKLAEKNADSPHRLAWLERSYAAARACAADGCA